MDLYGKNTPRMVKIIELGLREVGCLASLYGFLLVCFNVLEEGEGRLRVLRLMREESNTQNI
jgi:hypothetical protein